jgi:hypothetical protein
MEIKFDYVDWIHLALFNALNAELNAICHLLALLGGAIIVVVSRLKVKAQYLTLLNCVFL